jgi:glucose-6-phosphate 1-dehydrogenase
MVQNHLLPLLCLVAMEPPISLGERDLRDRKLDVLRSVRPIEEHDLATRTRRARYRAGQLGDRDIPAYADEDGVTPERGTETFAEVTLKLDSWRWSGTSFRLRTGKAIGQDRKEVVVHFRHVPNLPFGQRQESVPNLLRFGLEPEGLTLELTGTGPGVALSLVPLTLSAEMEPPELQARPIAERRSPRETHVGRDGVSDFRRSESPRGRQSRRGGARTRQALPASFPSPALSAAAMVSSI